MNLSYRVLSRYISLPEPSVLRHLLDDIGIEVKRVQEGNDDTIFGVELLANRGDHYCYQGVAREIHGRTGSDICGPIVTKLQVGNSPVPLSIETDKCFLYTATLLVRESEAQSFPSDVLAPLEAAGIHSLTSAIDATNLSNIELGQPTHAFDADTIVGGIVVRESRLGEKAWLLFTEEAVELPEGTVVIADDEKVLAIAGVIGCEESKTTESSTRILLESASFEPVAVRKAARSLNIHTDSVARFERGSDPTYPLVGAGRVVYLLETFGGFSRVGETGQVGDGLAPPAPIRLSVERLNKFLSIHLSEDEVCAYLERYGLSSQKGADGYLSVQIPPYRRWDISTDACLYEVIAIAVGYNETPISLPPIQIGAEPSPEEMLKAQVEEIFLAHGFYEVITDGFYSRQDRNRLNIVEGSPLFEHVETLNAIDRGYSLLKNNALLHAIDAVVKNHNQGQRQILMYEWTRCFLPDVNAANKVCHERKLIWAVASGQFLQPSWAGRGRVIDSLFMKGLLQEVSSLLRLPFRLEQLDESEPLFELLHPNRSASIWLDEVRVGVLGEFHPKLRADVKLKKARPIYLEIELEALMEKPQRQRYSLPPVHQPLVRTLAFALPHRIEARTVGHILSRFGAEVSVVDEFCYSEGDAAMRAITYELRYPNPSGTLSTDTVNAELQTLIQLVDSNLGEQGVHQR